MRVTKLEKLHQSDNLSLYQATISDDTNSVTVTKFLHPNPDLTTEAMSENYSHDRVCILIRAACDDKIILGGGDILSKQKSICLPYVIEPDNDRKRAAVLDFLHTQFHVNHIMKISLTHFPHVIKTGEDPAPEWLAVVDIDGDNNWFNNEYHWWTKGDAMRLIAGQQAMPDWLRGMLSGWIYMPHDTTSIRLMNGSLSATTVQDPNYPGIAVDYVRPDNTRIRLALTEFMSEPIDATPDHGEDQIEIPLQRLTPDCKQITPGLVTRAYPKMDNSDDEENRTFHYAD